MPPKDAAKPPTDDSPPIDLSTLWGSMSDAVLVIDREGRWLWAAPTLAYKSPGNRERLEFLIGKTFREVEPEQADKLLAAVHATLDSGETQQVEYEVSRHERRLWFAAAVSRIDDDRVLWVARNVTERVRARQILEDRVEERTRDLETLLEVTRTVASTLDLGEVLGRLLDQAKLLIPYNGASVNLLEGNELVVLDARAPKNDYKIGARFPVPTSDKRTSNKMWERLTNGEPVIVKDMFDMSDTMAVSYMRTTLAAGEQAVEALNRIRAWMVVPIAHHGSVIGTLSMSQPEPDFFTEEHARLAMAVAGQAAVAIENARLFEQKEERTRELSVLLDVSRELTAARELRPLARAMLEQIKRVIDYTGSSALTIEGDALRFIQSTGPQGIEEEQENLRLPLDPGIELVKKVLNGEHVIIEDVRGDGQLAADYRAMLGGSLEQPAYDYIRGWMAIPLHLEGRVIGLISLSKDVPGYFTEHHVELATAIARHAAVAAENATLLEETQRRTRELGALFEISRALSSTLELQPLLELILDELKSVIGYHGAEILLAVENGLRQFAVRRPEKYANAESNADRLWARGGMAWRRAEQGKPVLVDDLLGDSPPAVNFRRSWDRDGDLTGTPEEYARSALTVPLMLRDQLIGAFTFAHSEPGYYTRDHIELIQTVTGPAAAAIENARLFEQTEQRTRELSALLEVSRAVVSTLDVQELMAVILDQLHAILEHSGSAILVREGDDLVIMDARAGEGAEREIGARIPLGVNGGVWQVIDTGEPVLIADIRADEPMAVAYRAAINSIGLLDVPPFNLIRSWMAVPLTVGDDVIGMLTMSWTEPGYFTADHARLVAAFANQAALAIEHARLISQGQRLAAVEERQRLARELHDSVSQALYGIALGARTARTVLDRDPVKAIEPVDYVLSLAEAGLAEMRALIFELRPESLETEGIVAALNKQIAATSARYEIAVTADLCDEPDISLDRKEVLYRIAQEALHNTVKHARATSVRICLEHVDGRLSLTISDNGVGFDPAGDFPGHLGLKSMHERATQVRGDLRIESEPGVGTTVRAAVPAT